jgi:SAM-dependent methyltransferase
LKTVERLLRETTERIAAECGQPTRAAPRWSESHWCLAQAATAPVPGLLGDTSTRDYARKLQLFNSFAEPELRRAISSLNLAAGSCVLDAGCGTGQALRWFSSAVGPGGVVVGIDLARAHVAAARALGVARARVLHADLLNAPFSPASFDLIWCVNTINHLRDPVLGLKRLAVLLRPGGRIALGQSSLLPDMYFAWDSRLERLTNEAVRRFYLDRYGLREHDLTGVRSVVGWLRGAALRDVAVRTLTIERTSPLQPADEAYLLEAIFRDTWGERLRPYLPPAEYAELMGNCDPKDSRFALRRPDFHFLQSFTLLTGSI